MTPFLSDRPAPRDEDMGFVAEPAIKVGMILAHAQLQCLASGLRLGLAATSILVRGQLRLLGRLRSSSAEELPEELGTVVDEARACLREVAEAATAELGQLKRSFGSLDEAARNLVPRLDDSEQPFRRRCKVKP
jgi:hypothetical protein